jgi:hypothetical protein
MKTVFIVFMVFLILAFLAGIYFCMHSSNLYVVPYEGMEGDSAAGSNRVISGGGSGGAGPTPGSGGVGVGGGDGCPNLLVRSGNSILLYNTNRPNDETNPIPFYNLDEYANYLEIQKHKGVHCPVLFLQQETNTQGDDVYRMRPDIFNPQPGLLQNMPTPPNQPPKVVPVVDASRSSRIYNKNEYAGFDPYGLQVGQYSVLDKIHDSTGGGAPLSDNPMDPNWGGVVYTQQKVDSGKYDDNQVMVPTYSQAANVYSYPQLYKADGTGRRPPNYTLPKKDGQTQDRWSEDSTRAGAYDVNTLATVNSGTAYNDRIDAQPDNNKNTVANPSYSATIPGMKYEMPKPVSYQTNANNWDKYNGGSGNVDIGSVHTGVSGGKPDQYRNSYSQSKLAGSSASASTNKNTKPGPTGNVDASGSLTFSQINTAILNKLNDQQDKFYVGIVNAALVAISDKNQTRAINVLQIVNLPQSLIDTIASTTQTVIQNLMNTCSALKSNPQDPANQQKITDASQPLITLLEEQYKKLSKSQLEQLDKIDKELAAEGPKFALQLVTAVLDTIYAQCGTSIVKK